MVEPEEDVGETIAEVEETPTLHEEETPIGEDDWQSTRCCIEDW